MKPFENLTELLEWLAEAYPERCKKHGSILTFKLAEEPVWVGERSDAPYRLSSLEYLLREIIEAEFGSWDVSCSGDYCFAQINDRVVHKYKNSSPVLALGSALREVKT